MPNSSFVVVVFPGESITISSYLLIIEVRVLGWYLYTNLKNFFGEIQPIVSKIDLNTQRIFPQSICKNSNYPFGYHVFIKEKSIIYM